MYRQYNADVVCSNLINKIIINLGKKDRKTLGPRRLIRLAYHRKAGSLSPRSVRSRVQTRYCEVQRENLFGALIMRRLEVGDLHWQVTPGSLLLTPTESGTGPSASDP